MHWSRGRVCRFGGPRTQRGGSGILGYQIFHPDAACTNQRPISASMHRTRVGFPPVHPGRMLCCAMVADRHGWGGVSRRRRTFETYSTGHWGINGTVRDVPGPAGKVFSWRVPVTKPPAAIYDTDRRLELTAAVTRAPMPGNGIGFPAGVRVWSRSCGSTSNQEHSNDSTHNQT